MLSQIYHLTQCQIPAVQQFLANKDMVIIPTQCKSQPALNSYSYHFLDVAVTVNRWAALGLLLSIYYSICYIYDPTDFFESFAWFILWTSYYPLQYACISCRFTEDTMIDELSNPTCQYDFSAMPTCPPPSIATEACADHSGRFSDYSQIALPVVPFQHFESAADMLKAALDIMIGTEIVTSAGTKIHSSTLVIINLFLCPLLCCITSKPQRKCVLKLWALVGTLQSIFSPLLENSPNSYPRQNA
jgi:hypothetical protein